MRSADGKYEYVLTAYHCLKGLVYPGSMPTAAQRQQSSTIIQGLGQYVFQVTFDYTARCNTDDNFAPDSSKTCTVCLHPKFGSSQEDLL